MPFCKKCKREIKSLGWANHRAAHRRNEEKRVEKLISAFNNIYQVGEKLKFRIAVHEPQQIVTVKSPAYNHHGNPVVWFEEINSFCSIEADFIDYKNKPAK